MRKSRSHPKRLSLFVALLGALLSHALPTLLMLAGGLALLLALSPLRSPLDAVSSLHVLGVRGYGLAFVVLGLRSLRGGKPQSRLVHIGFTVAGFLIVLGVWPKFSFGTIALLLFTESLTHHRFWAAPTPHLRAAREGAFARNLALMASALALLGIL